eukprot:1159218-Pelagomonas_calceolata.AAC.3
MSRCRSASFASAYIHVLQPSGSVTDAYDHGPTPCKDKFKSALTQEIAAEPLLHTSRRAPVAHKPQSHFCSQDYSRLVYLVSGTLLLQLSCPSRQAQATGAYTWASVEEYKGSRLSDWPNSEVCAAMEPMNTAGKGGTRKTIERRLGSSHTNIV